MIPVAHVPEPSSFDERVRKPGEKWLKTHPEATRPYPYWSSCRSALKKGFHDLCGYAAMLDPSTGTVDHYLSYKNHPELTYEWSNYRFASATLNQSKKKADDAVLDPYEVGAGWFEIILPSLQMRVTEAIPDAYRMKAEYTLNRLRLRDGEIIIQWRQAWYEMYLSGDLTLTGLRKVAPLLADAIERDIGSWITFLLGNHPMEI